MWNAHQRTQKINQPEKEKPQTIPNKSENCKVIEMDDENDTRLSEYLRKETELNSLN